MGDEKETRELRPKKPGLNYKSLSEYGFPSLNATDPGKSSTPRKKIDLCAAKALDQMVSEKLDSEEETSEEELEELRKKLKETERRITKKKEDEKKELRKKIADGEKLLQSMKGETTKNKKVDKKVDIGELRKMEKLNDKVNKQLVDLGLFDNPIKEDNKSKSGKISSKAGRKKKVAKSKVKEKSSSDSSPDSSDENCKSEKDERHKSVKKSKTIIVSNSSSDNSESEDDELVEKSKGGKKKIKSGIQSKSSDKVKNQLLWPHSALQYEYVNESTSFNNLDIKLFTAGELEIITSGEISEVERNGRLNLLKKITY